MDIIAAIVEAVVVVKVLLWAVSVVSRTVLGLKVLVVDAKADVAMDTLAGVEIFAIMVAAVVIPLVLVVSIS